MFSKSFSVAMNPTVECNSANEHACRGSRYSTMFVAAVVYEDFMFGSPSALKMPGCSFKCSSTSKLVRTLGGGGIFHQPFINRPLTLHTEVQVSRQFSSRCCSCAYTHTYQIRKRIEGQGYLLSFSHNVNSKVRLLALDVLFKK